MNNKYIIFCDFDGTITKQDTLDTVFEKYRAGVWREYVNQAKEFLITIPEESTQECVYLLEPKHSLSQQQAWTIIKQPGLPNTLYQINFFQTLSEHELTTDLIIGSNNQL